MISRQLLLLSYTFIYPHHHVHIVASSPSSLPSPSRPPPSSSSINNIEPPGYTNLIQSMLEQRSDEGRRQHQSHELDKNSIGIDEDRRNLVVEQQQQQSLYNMKTQKLRLHFVTSPIERTMSSLTDESLKQTGRDIIDTVLPAIANEFNEAISIQPSAGLQLSNTICFNLFTEYFNYDEGRITYPNVDVVIFVSAFEYIAGNQWCNDDNPSLSTLASAAPCSLSNTNDRPHVGFINVCLNAVQSKLKRLDDVNHVLSHEILHVLILSSDLFKYYRNGVDGTPLTTRNWVGRFDTHIVQCVDGMYRTVYKTCPNTISIRKENVVMNGILDKERPYYEITLPTVRQVVQNHFHCQSLSGARLENQPTNPDDCTGSHLDERYFFQNVMSAIFLTRSSTHFSPLLLALMEDSGWYKANFRIAKNGSFGLNAGCDFVKKDCIIHGNIPEYSEGFFCNDLYDFTSPYQCGPTRTYRGRCDLARYGSYNGRTYFDSVVTGPLQFYHADWCPMVNLDREFCSEDSICLDAIVGGSKQTTAFCVESFCNPETQQFVFKVGTSFFSCNAEDRGRVIEADWNGRLYGFKCPTLTQVCPDMFCPAMCSGKGICNWDADPVPICECFNPNDKTAGCFDSEISQPGECNDSGVIETLTPSSNPTIRTTLYHSGMPTEQPTTSLFSPLSSNISTSPSISSAPSRLSISPSSKERSNTDSAQSVLLSMGSMRYYSSFLLGTSVVLILQMIFW